MNSFDFLVENGRKEAKAKLQGKVKDTKADLQKQLMSIEETGPTALGPALLTAVAMAAEGAPGSTVVLCTDGLANIGLGAMDEAHSEAQVEALDAFYAQIGILAKENGVTVNIVSIEGEECNLDTLSKIAEVCGGNVERVAPVQLTQNFSNILSTPVIASKVQVTVKLHKGLEFRNEEQAYLKDNGTTMMRELGNVTEETEITFEYRLKSIKELIQMEDVELTQLTALPFQAQITYTALNGARCVRVIS